MRVERTREGKVFVEDVNNKVWMAGPVSKDWDRSERQRYTGLYARARALA